MNGGKQRGRADKEQRGMDIWRNDTAEEPFA
jgi:hypothetical protein